MFRRIITKLKYLLKFLIIHRNAWKHSFELKLAQDNTEKINKNDIILFSTMKNETFRLPYFLKYYRELGVKHFIFVDNNSDDGMMDQLQNDEDVTIFFTDSSYKDSNFGMHWLNYLLRKYGTGHWCVTCDPDEFLVYPYNDTRDLHDLTSYLDASSERSFFTVMSDMYGEKSIEETLYESGDSPLNVCPYFDKKGYSEQHDHFYRNIFVQGGVRSRVFSSDDPSEAPALNKLPLIKWRRYDAYVLSTHMAIPQVLNEVVKPHHTTGALLHFKFLDKFVEKVETELAAKQHWNDSGEYIKYHDAIKNDTFLYDKSFSEKYTDWISLEKHGLINRGEFL